MNNTKTALITGVTGQDGAYMAKHLLDHNYSVVGLHRGDLSDLWRIDKLKLDRYAGLEMREHNLADLDSNQRLIEESQFDEVYNFAAISSLAEANDAPLKTALINAMVPISLLEGIRKTSPLTRLFQASSAEIFGENRSKLQSESTKLAPVGSYALAKTHAHKMVEYYRSEYGLFACNGILYNHESPLRGDKFVSRKIIDGLVDVAAGRISHIEIGNLDAKRDWGFAQDYVTAMHLMLTHQSPNTYILSTGRLSTVRRFISLVCQALDIDIQWQGHGMNEVGKNASSGATIVRVDPKYYRAEPSEFATGSASRALEVLNWSSTTTLEKLCTLMVEDALTGNSL